MNINELEKMIRDGIKAKSPESTLAFIADNSATVPAEYIEAAKTLASRTGAAPDEAANKDAEQKPWI